VALVLLPARVPIIALPIAVLLTVLLGRADPQGAATTLAFGFFMLLTYEWTHFLIHSKYRPRRAYYRVIWRNHRNHHFRNENYWFGVTMDFADRVLRTAPERDVVPVSATAKNLEGAWK
jgi:sterol desaturase/sphingolipid hydroxylase (fatty acid hydroxylase superfamily)